MILLNVSLITRLLRVLAIQGVLKLAINILILQVLYNTLRRKEANSLSVCGSTFITDHIIIPEREIHS